MLTNKKAPSRTKADEDYLLTTKLFCGDCGRLMAGECGTSGTNGVKYYYYKCGGAKRKLGCKRKALKKNWIERAAVIATIERVLRDDEIDRIADAIIDLQNREDTTLPALRQQLKDCEQGIENMLNAIQMGILTPSTKTRLEELESQRESLKVSILQAELEKPKYTKEQIVNWINRFKYGNVDDIEYQRQIIDTFINAIYVYDDKLVFTYNFKDGTEAIPLKAVEDAFGSDLTQVAPPNPRNPNIIPVGGWVRISSFYLKYCGVINKTNERRRIGIIPIVPALKITIGQELTSTECERLPYFTNGFIPSPASSSGSRSGTSPCGRRCRPIAAALRASPAPPLRRPSAPRSDPRRKRCASDEQ